MSNEEYGIIGEQSVVYMGYSATISIFEDDHASIMIHAGGWLLSRSTDRSTVEEEAFSMLAEVVRMWGEGPADKQIKCVGEDHELADWFNKQMGQGSSTGAWA